MWSRLARGRVSGKREVIFGAQDLPLFLTLQLGFRSRGFFSNFRPKFRRVLCPRETNQNGRFATCAP